MTKTEKASFTLTLQLNTTHEDEQYLHKAFGIACRMQNVAVKHVKHCINALERNPRYQELMELYKKDKKFSPKEKQELKDLRLSVGLSEYQLHRYIAEQQHKYNKYIDSFTAQKIATRVWRATDSYLFKNGEMLHFKKRRFYTSVEGKSNSTGIRFVNRHVLWKHLYMPVRIRKKDAYARYILKHYKVSYCRIIRKWHKHQWKYYVQLVFRGIPPLKHEVKEGSVGIDAGVSTVAAVSDDAILFQPLGEGIDRIDRQLRILQRKLDRQRRANNPDNYNEDGTVKRNSKNFRRKWKKSRKQVLTEHKIKTLYAKRAAKLKQHHEELANAILLMGNHIYVEDMNYAALGRRSSKTEKLEKTGKFKKKKRFGKSLQNYAPSMFLSILDRKLKYHGLSLNMVNQKVLAPSQFDHTTGERIETELKDRWKVLGNGDLVQRDLYSAFLIKHVIGIELDAYDYEAIEKDYLKFLKIHNETIEYLRNEKKAGRTYPACMGI